MGMALLGTALLQVFAAGALAMQRPPASTVGPRDGGNATYLASALAPLPAAPEHPDDPADGPWKLGLVAHRKTGYVLTSKAAGCFPYHTVTHMTWEAFEAGTVTWEGLGGRNIEKLAHFARDPFDLLVSTFVYDRVTSVEYHTLRTGSAREMKDLCRRYFHPVSKQLPHTSYLESYRAYLLRITEQEALAMVMCQSKHVLDGLVEAWRGCQSHQHCTQVTLGDFTESSASYINTWQKISSFAGIDMGEVNHTCLMRQDVHSPTFKPDHHDHRSTVDASEAYRAHVKATAMALDAELFQGYYQQAKDAMAV